jgi:glycosyltransferase involved in cell wall biosynthesis
MRKCLFIAANEWPNWGGSELLWTQAAEKMARRGAKVFVSVPDFGKPLNQVERLRAAGCHVFARARPALPFRLATRIFRFPDQIRKQVRTMAGDADLVVISQGAHTDGLPWMEEATAARHKYVVIAQGAPEHGWPDDDVAERLARAYENASRSFFVSQALIDLCRRQFGTPLSNGRVIRNPFNVRYDARPPWPDNGSEELTLACVARIDVGTKGQDLLLRVLSLPHWRERKVRLSLVGGGLNERVLRRYAEQLKVKGVEFPGHREDIEEVWSKHQAMVLPSRQEGMPLTLVEAMLCGRTCIVTDVGGSRELVRDGTNGFLAKAPTVELLDEAMNRAWESRGKLREMGERAAVDVRQWVSADPAEDFVRELEALVE